MFRGICVSLATGVVCAIAFAAYLVLPLRAPTPSLPMSTVKVQTETGHGSGVHIGNGLVLTAAHVVKDLEFTRIKTQDDVTVDAVTLWSNTNYDAALLYAPALRAKASPVSCRAPLSGEHVRVSGNPVSWEFLSVEGAIIGSIPMTYTRRGHIVVNITTLPGMSGGPYFDDVGQVIGIVQGGVGQFAFDFMVPMSEICRLLGRV